MQRRLTAADTDPVDRHSIKAALDVLLDYGRPDKVELCVLIDRKEHRQFPIQADYVGKTVVTSKDDKVKLVNKEVVLMSN